MSGDGERRDLPAMTMDILASVLGRADKPVDVGDFLTLKVRELTGARCVIVLQSLHAAGDKANRVISVNPSERQEWAESPAADRLYECARDMSAAQICRSGDASEAAVLLHGEGFDLSVGIPLCIGSVAQAASDREAASGARVGGHVGALLVLGIPDERHLSSLIGLLQSFSTIVALVLRNAFLFEKQELLIAERTRELLAGNEGLRESEAKIRSLLDQAQRSSDLLLSTLEDERFAQEALQNESTFTSAILNTAQAIILVLDNEGRIARCNRYCEELSGYTIAEAVGRKPWEFLLLPDEAEGVKDTLAVATRSGESTHHENFWVTKSGALRRLAWVNSAICDQQGNPQYIVCIATDITLRKQAEDELKRYREHLEELVDSRTRALEDSNRELKAAKEAAEAANRAKSIFLASMSHELRTPLNAVLGFSQIMQGDPTLSDSQKENLKIINRSGAHLLGLINDVLDVSKIEAGQVARNEIVFDLWNDLQTIAEMMQVRAAAKGLSFVLEWAPTVPRHIKADQKKFKQILINLAGNAVKFTESGSVAVRVSADPQSRMLRCDVQDTGPGIAAAQLSRLFEAFSQANESCDGVGLGLFISRKLSEIMGGRISVQSEPGKGSLFIFETPWHIAPADEVLPLGSRPRVAGLAPGQPIPRILVAEDSKVNRLLMVKTLRSAGFDVLEAENGEEAVESFAIHRPNLVLMDIRMPVMDGDEATRRIKATEAGKATPIIIVSASAFDEDRQKMFATGADDFIGKPIQTDNLFEKIRTHLGVAYVYHEECPKSAECLDTAALDIMIAGLPAHLVAELRQALDSLDLSEFNAWMPEVSTHSPALAKALAGLANAYEIDRLAKLLDRTELP